MNPELLKSLDIELSYELNDFLNNSGHDNIYDYAHEIADNDADVIYYDKSEALYNSASVEEQNNAEQQVEETGGFGPDVNTKAQRFTVLAFWIIKERLESQLREELEELEDELNDKISKLEEIRDEITY
tara:strand:- start:301 stop:687 length:387 start_codon:yes stop_codon:yes gene_type:complete